MADTGVDLDNLTLGQLKKFMSKKMGAAEKKRLLEKVLMQAMADEEKPKDTEQTKSTVKIKEEKKPETPKEPATSSVTSSSGVKTDSKFSIPKVQEKPTSSSGVKTDSKFSIPKVQVEPTSSSGVKTDSKFSIPKVQEKPTSSSGVKTDSKFSIPKVQVEPEKKEESVAQEEEEWEEVGEDMFPLMKDNFSVANTRDFNRECGIEVSYRTLEIYPIKPSDLGGKLLQHYLPLASTFSIRFYVDQNQQSNEKRYVLQMNFRHVEDAINAADDLSRIRSGVKVEKLRAQDYSKCLDNKQKPFFIGPRFSKHNHHPGNTVPHRGTFAERLIYLHGIPKDTPEKQVSAVYPNCLAAFIFTNCGSEELNGDGIVEFASVSEAKTAFRKRRTVWIGITAVKTSYYAAQGRKVDPKQKEELNRELAEEDLLLQYPMTPVHRARIVKAVRKLRQEQARYLCRPSYSQGEKQELIDLTKRLGDLKDVFLQDNELRAKLGMKKKMLPNDVQTYVFPGNKAPARLRRHKNRPVPYTVPARANQEGAPIRGILRPQPMLPEHLQHDPHNTGANQRQQQTEQQRQEPEKKFEGIPGLLEKGDIPPPPLPPKPLLMSNRPPQSQQQWPTLATRTATPPRTLEERKVPRPHMPDTQTSQEKIKPLMRPDFRQPIGPIKPLMSRPNLPEFYPVTRPKLPELPSKTRSGRYDLPHNPFDVLFEKKPTEQQQSSRFEELYPAHHDENRSQQSYIDRPLSRRSDEQTSILGEYPSDRPKTSIQDTLKRLSDILAAENRHEASPEVNERRQIVGDEQSLVNERRHRNFNAEHIDSIIGEIMDSSGAHAKDRFMDERRNALLDALEHETVLKDEMRQPRPMGAPPLMDERRPTRPQMDERIPLPLEERRPMRPKTGEEMMLEAALSLPENGALRDERNVHDDHIDALVDDIRDELHGGRPVPPAAMTRRRPGPPMDGILGPVPPRRRPMDPSTLDSQMLADQFGSEHSALHDERNLHDDHIDAIVDDIMGELHGGRPVPPAAMTRRRPGPPMDGILGPVPPRRRPMDPSTIDSQMLADQFGSEHSAIHDERNLHDDHIDAIVDDIRDELNRGRPVPPLAMTRRHPGPPIDDDIPDPAPPRRRPMESQMLADQIKAEKSALYAERNVHDEHIDSIVDDFRDELHGGRPVPTAAMTRRRPGPPMDGILGPVPPRRRPMDPLQIESVMLADQIKAEKNALYDERNLHDEHINALTDEILYPPSHRQRDELHRGRPVPPPAMGRRRPGPPMDDEILDPTPRRRPMDHPPIENLLANTIDGAPMPRMLAGQRESAIQVMEHLLRAEDLGSRFPPQ